MVLKHDYGAIECCLPVSNRTVPFLRDVSDRKIEQFDGGLVVTEGPLFLMVFMKVRFTGRL